MARIFPVLLSMATAAPCNIGRMRSSATRDAAFFFVLICSTLTRTTSFSWSARPMLDCGSLSGRISPSLMPTFSGPRFSPAPSTTIAGDQCTS